MSIRILSVAKITSVILRSPGSVVKGLL